MKSIEVDGIEYRFFDHLYAVSRCGKVLRKLAPYTPTKHPSGYLSLGRQRLMHRVIATCWIDNPNNANHVHHKNGIKTDNRAENLEWITPKQHFGERHINHGRHVVSDEAKEKLRSVRIGKKHSEETKEKIRSSSIGKPHKSFARQKHSQEWKDNASLNHPKNACCIVYGVTYRSLAEASRKTGIHRFTIRKRCLSKNFPDYEIISFSS